MALRHTKMLQAVKIQDWQFGLRGIGLSDSGGMVAGEAVHLGVLGSTPEPKPKELARPFGLAGIVKGDGDAVRSGP